MAAMPTFWCRPVTSGYLALCHVFTSMCCASMQPAPACDAEFAFRSQMLCASLKEGSSHSTAESMRTRFWLESFDIKCVLQWDIKVKIRVFLLTPESPLIALQSLSPPHWRPTCKSYCGNSWIAHPETRTNGYMCMPLSCKISHVAICVCR